MCSSDLYADGLIKDPATARRYEITPGSVAPRGSHDGLECRWQDIPSRYGETVSLMVRALDADAERAAGVYRQVIAKVREIYGDDDACHPLSVPDLAMTLDGGRLGNEIGVRAAMLIKELCSYPYVHRTYDGKLPDQPWLAARALPGRKPQRATGT